MPRRFLDAWPANVASETERDNSILDTDLRSPVQAGVRRTVYRHPPLVRIFHWVNALSFVLLLVSGLQIFNAYPRLHWGHDGYAGMPAVFEIAGIPDLKRNESWVKIGSHRINTTGVFGVAKDVPFSGVTNMAFPS